MLLTDQVFGQSASSSCPGAQAEELTSASGTGVGDPLDSRAPAVFWRCPFLEAPALSQGRAALLLMLPGSRSQGACPSEFQSACPSGSQSARLSLGVQCAAGQTPLHATAFCTGARVCANGCFRHLLSSGICLCVPLNVTYNLSSKIKVLRSSRQQQRRADQAWALCSAGAARLHSQVADAGDLPGLHTLLGSFWEGNWELVKVSSRK